MDLVKIRERRATALANARVIIDSAEEGKELSDEQKAQVDSFFAEADAAAEEEAAAERKLKLETAEAELRQTAGRKVQPGRSYSRKELNKHEASELFRSWALNGVNGNRANSDQLFRAAEAGVDLNALSMEYRALSKGTSNAGGYTVPQSFSDQLEKILAYYFNVGDAVETFTTADGRDYPWPTVTDTSNAAAIVAEAGTIGSSTDPTFGQVTFKCWDYYSPIVKVSNQLLRDSARDIGAVLAELFAERMGRALDAAVVSSNAGTAAPQGILLNISAGVNLADGNAITFAKLLALEGSVDLAYRSSPGCAFLMHDATWQAIRALVDSTGRPLVNMDMQSGVDKRLLGYPVYISNNMTSISSPGDNQPLILFGDLKRYKLRRVGGATLTKLVELYAGTGQVGFNLHEAFDGRWITTGAAKTLNSFDAA